MDDFLRLVLRLVGAFYLLAAIVGLRAVAMDRLLSGALAALAAGSGPSAGERLRNRFLTLSSLTIGAAALALLALLDVAAILMAAALALQIAYLGWLGPRIVDREEPPEPASRGKSVMATAVIAAATCLVVAAWHRGLLLSVGQAPVPGALAVAGFAALLVYGLRLSRAADLTRRAPALDDVEPPAFDDEPFTALPDIDLAEIAAIRVVLCPGWAGLGVLDAATGEPLRYAVYEALLMPHERELLADWNCLFIKVADPNDPRRAAMSAPDGLRQLQKAGRPIHEAIASRLGPERVDFEPAPRPRDARIEVEAVKVMADHGCYALWFHDEERAGCFAPSDFGLSWNLELGLGGWATDFDDSVDLDDPGGPARWSRDEAWFHAESGRDLARQLARELAATGRGRVRVLYHPVGAAAPEIVSPAP